MIRRLRDRHRTVTLACAIIASTVLAAASWHRAPPVFDNTPVANRPAAVRPADLVVRDRRTIATAAGALTLTVHRRASPNGALYASIRPERSDRPHAPDVLVYWQPDAGDTLSDGAILLAPLSVRAEQFLALPDGATDRAGTLVLYSLARGDTLAAVNLDGPP